MEANKYQKLNQLLNEKSISSQILLNQLQNLKKSHFNQNNHQYVYPEYADTMGFVGEMQKYVDLYVENHQQNGPLLLHSENAIFRQIIGLQIQSSQLKDKLQKSRRNNSEAAKQLQRMKANPDLIFNDGIRRQKNLLFGQQQFQKVRVEIKQLSQEVDATNTLNSQLDHKIQVLKDMNSQLDTRKAQLLDRIQGRQILLENKQRLVFLHPKKQEQEEQEINGEQIIAVLNARLQLQVQMQTETAQKQQFYQLLLDFQKKSHEVTKKNHELKGRLKQKGIQVPI